MRTKPFASSVVLTAVLITASIAAHERPETSDESVPKKENSAVRSARTLSDVIATGDCVTVKEGFVLHLYSNEQVTQTKSREADYNRRRGEYQAKLTSLQERRSVVERKLPDERYQRLARSYMQRFDANRDLVLDGEELKNFGQADAFDINKDGKITAGEFIKALLAKRTEQAAPPASTGTVSEDWDEILKESASLAAEIELLTQEYKDVLSARPDTTFYKVSEVGKDFARLQSEEEERIIPIRSIQEIRRKRTQ